MWSILQAVPWEQQEGGLWDALGLLSAGDGLKEASSLKSDGEMLLSCLRGCPGSAWKVNTQQSPP